MTNHFEHIYLIERFKNLQFVVFSGPSGGGKTTIIKEVEKLADNYEVLIKNTDRPVRREEVNGVDYYFCSSQEFENTNNFVAVISRYDHLYGLLISEIEKALSKGKIPCFILDPNAAIAFKKIYQNAIIIFVGPEDSGVIEKRLTDRGDESGEIKKRLILLKEEYTLRPQFDYNLYNQPGDVNKILNILKG